MPQTSITKTDLLRAIDIEREWWRVVFDLAAEDGPLPSDEIIDGTWTFKTLVAHIDGWLVWTLVRMQAIAGKNGKPATPWPANLTDSTQAGVDKINAWFEEQARKQSLETVIANFQNHLNELRLAVEHTPENELLASGHFAWLGEEFASSPIGPALIGSSHAHVHIAHAPALEDWLTRKRGQHAELPPTPSDFGFVQ